MRGVILANGTEHFDWAMVIAVRKYTPSSCLATSGSELGRNGGTSWLQRDMRWRRSGRTKR